MTVVVEMIQLPVMKEFTVHCCPDSTRQDLCSGSSSEPNPSLEQGSPAAHCPKAQ